ncbi:MAG: Gldg family protein [Phycisphaerae bacterium]
MAVSNTQGSAMSQASRRTLYSAVFILNCALFLVVLVFAVWGAGRLGWKKDVSSAGTNSLSQRTVQLVRDLGENVTVTGLYSTALKEVRPHAEKHRNKVADLLDLYETAGRGKVSTKMIDPQSQPQEVEALLTRLAEKPAYKDEAKPHADLLAAFPQTSQKISGLLKPELTQLDEIIKNNEALDRVTIVQNVRRAFGESLKALDAVSEDLATLKAGPIPRYQTAVDAVKQQIEQMRKILQESGDWLSANGPSMPGVTADARTFFAGARDRYTPLITELDDQLKRLSELKPVKLDEVYNELKSGENLLVETEKEAIAVSGNDVWIQPRDGRPPAPDGDQLAFSGEAAVSSAVLKLTQKEKTAVVFVRWGGEALLTPDFSKFNPMQQQMPQARCGKLNELMTRENFVTQDWDVQTSPTPPAIEGAKRTIYVVYPPEQTPPSQQNPRPQGMSPEQRKAVLDAVAQSGMAIFMVGWNQPQGPMAMMSAGYEYADWLSATWGIQPRTEYLAMHFQPNPQQPNLWMPAQRGQQAMVLNFPEPLRYSEHEIVRPLQSLPGGILAAAPLMLTAAESRPAGVTVEPLLEIPASENVWAFSNIQRVSEDFGKKQGTQRYEDDMPSPLVLAAAASSGDARLVVFGSEDFVNDNMIDAAGLALVGGSLTMARIYPANGDLFINALHWLTKDSNRIAVGPSQGDVPRLDKLKNDGTLVFSQIFLVGILPLISVAVTGLVTLLIRAR